MPIVIAGTLSIVSIIWIRPELQRVAGGAASSDACVIYAQLKDQFAFMDGDIDEKPR